MRFIKSVLSLAIVFFSSCLASAQRPTNVNSNQGVVNVSLPKTPESQGFEQFGNTPVNELTGTPDISIPIYELRSKFIDVPINLSYHPTGIKVNQEASWVGLGWDLIVGGRITVETKGSIDFDPSTAGLFSTTNLSYGMRKLFNRLGNANGSAILTYATVCRTCTANDTVPDDFQSMEAMAEYGAGEPDVFHANFMGHSFSFYFDKVAGNLAFIGEQTLFSIYKTMDGARIGGFTIIDNDGVYYFFNQVETSTISLPSSAIQTPTSNSAWLLTKILHTTGDYVQFNYANYGNSYPAFNWSSSLNAQLTSTGTLIGAVNRSNDVPQNQITLTPYYLTSIQTQDAEIDFTLDDRTDIYGLGNKKLSSLKIRDRNTGIIRKTVAFNYSYFTATTTNNCIAYLPQFVSANVPQSAYLAPYNQRLRLDSLTINSPDVSPYKFYYNDIVPDKYSFSQDHWGYYNAANNNGNGCSPQSLIPYTGVGTSINVPSMDGTADRQCNPSVMAAMTLDSMVYPTGGSTKFVFEPHETSTSTGGFSGFIGGGLRIKTISHYVSSRVLATKTNYIYPQGEYMGRISYATTYAKMQPCPATLPDYIQYNLSSNGAVNENNLLVAYPSVTIKQTGPSGESNGSLIKTFNVPSLIYSGNGYGYQTVPSHWPNFSTNPPNNLITPLYSGSAGFAPTPVGLLDGKLLSDQYFDNADNLIKSIKYYYEQANYSQNFYSVQAVDNMVGGLSNASCPGSGIPQYYEVGGNRAIVLFISPGKSFTTLIDSTVETHYQGASTLIEKKYYTYNSHFMPQTLTLNNSDGKQTVFTYKYTYDYASNVYTSGTPSVYQIMVGNHIYSPVVSTSVAKNGVPLNYSINNYYSPSQGVFVPQNTQLKIGNNDIELRMLYNAFDSYGHILEQQKPNGVKETYLYGYNSQYPVAKVVGSDYTTVSGLVTQSTLDNATGNGDDATIRSALAPLRTIPNALATTYTYKPLVGITSQTSPNGMTSYFEYDAMGRLSLVRDKDNNIIKRYCYSYNGQQGACPASPAAAATVPPTTTTPTTPTGPGVYVRLEIEGSYIAANTYGLWYDYSQLTSVYVRMYSDPQCTQRLTLTQDLPFQYGSSTVTRNQYGQGGQVDQGSTYNWAILAGESEYLVDNIIPIYAYEINGYDLDAYGEPVTRVYSTMPTIDCGGGATHFIIMPTKVWDSFPPDWSPMPGNTSPSNCN